MAECFVGLAPRQFENIGYFAHRTDPAGAKIDLLQHGSKGSKGKVRLDHPMACGAILADVTSRVRDLVAPLSWCAGQGLHQNSVQPLDEYGFTLHFHAYQRETASHGSITAVANRPWLWQGPDELQHLHGS